MIIQQCSLSYTHLYIIYMCKRSARIDINEQFIDWHIELKAIKIKQWKSYFLIFFPLRQIVGKAPLAANQKKMEDFEVGKVNRKTAFNSTVTVTV